MTEDQAIKTIKSYLEKKFPKECNCCGRLYTSLKDYLLNTVHTGNPHSYDAEMQRWRPSKPYGTHSLAHCKCGTTLSISSRKMKITTMWKLLYWARKEASRRNISTNELLAEIRERIDQQVLSGKSSD